MSKEQCSRKYNIYNTEEDYKNKKAFVTLIGNKNPTMVTYVNKEEPDGARIVDWDLVEFESVRDEYHLIVPKPVLEYDGVYYVEKTLYVLYGKNSIAENVWIYGEIEDLVYIN